MFRKCIAFYPPHDRIRFFLQNAFLTCHDYDELYFGVIIIVDCILTALNVTASVLCVSNLFSFINPGASSINQQPEVRLLEPELTCLTYRWCKALLRSTGDGSMMKAGQI